jgi:glutamate---cysteine ligase / carboxylate-amine ligase
MDADRLTEAFDAVEPFTVGIEEEVMLLHPDTLDLADRAPALLRRFGNERSPFKLELPASQIELVTPPCRSVPEAIADLGAARGELLVAAAGLARPAAAGAHPFAAAEGALNHGRRYDRAAAEYGWVARRQLVCALQVHVAVGGAERTLAVYNALREELPALAALAANAPLRGGHDTGLASVRPLISGMLPRQGIPPALASWEELAEGLRWGAAAGAIPEPGFWWWELRPHLRFGTLELRVPDAQTTLADAAAVAAVAHALVVELAERHDAGELGGAPTPSWRIEENRWSACRHGMDGALADLRSGEPISTSEHVAALLDRLAPVAERLGAAEALTDARRLARRNGAARQREVAAEHGPLRLARWLADRFADGLPAQRGFTSPTRVTERI